MPGQDVSKTTITAILVATTAALFARVLFQIELRNEGMAHRTAGDLSYLIVPLILAFLLFPHWRSQKTFLANLYKPSDLTWTTVLQAIAIGVLLRLAWWGKTIAGISFGFTRADDSLAIVAPIFSFECASPAIVILGIAVTVFMMPLIEEVTHRGYVVSALRRRGPVASIGISALVFMILHTPAISWFVLGGGVVLGIQYWRSQSLWASTLSHSVYNGLIQIDWYCLDIHWSPGPNDPPLPVPGITATATFLASIWGIIYLLKRMNHGAHSTPRSTDST